MLFPRIHLKTLSGSPIIFPDDLNELAVVLLPTRRRQQEECDQWAACLPKLKKINSEIDYYEMPVLGHLWLWMKPIIDRGMKGGLPQESQKKTVCFYGHKDQLFEELDITPGENVDVFLIYKEHVVAHYNSPESIPTLISTVQEFTESIAPSSGLGA